MIIIGVYTDHLEGDDLERYEQALRQYGFDGADGFYSLCEGTKFGPSGHPVYGPEIGDLDRDALSDMLTREGDGLLALLSDKISGSGVQVLVSDGPHGRGVQELLLEKGVLSQSLQEHYS